MSKQAQTFKIHEITGKVSNVSIPVVGGCNIHKSISKYLNDQLQAVQPFDPNDLSKVRNFKVVYGHPQIDGLHAALFADGSKDAPDFDNRFDEYFAKTYLSADRENRNLIGKEFSEQAFLQAPDSMSVHVTIALS